MSMWAMDWIGYALLTIHAFIAWYLWRNGRAMLADLHSAACFLGRPENMPLCFLVGATVVPVALYFSLVAVLSLPIAVLIVVLP